MVGKDSDDQTNLQLLKVGRSGKVKVAGEEDVKNKDAAAFKHLMAKMQEEARPVGYLFGKGALDHDDLLYLKEQNQAEEDAFRQRELEEKRAFAAFKAAASATDLSTSSLGTPANPVPASTSTKVQQRQRSGIRQSSLLQSIVSVRPKKQSQGLTRSDSGSSSLSSPSAAKKPRIGAGGGGKLAASNEAATCSSAQKTAAVEQHARSSGASIPAVDPSGKALSRDAAAAAAAQAPRKDSDCAASEVAEHGLVKTSSGQGALLGLAYDDSEEEDEET